ncbi:probable NAD kinase 2, chloroplastic [Phalaenopsis equestris]|uniref:probable NAD kinase 2, chloroplastic n=1 Tax=Phalaenopsis equestris TaxID=78828 RepID=UPI0009E4406A|nr:probable NAD kinase 2, chloroplastic [Phalaenopsis equestris]
MLAAFWGHGPLNTSLLPGKCSDLRVFDGCNGFTAYFTRKDKWWRRAVGCGGGEGETLKSGVARARLTSSLPPSIDLDLQTVQINDRSQLLWVGPLPGDIAEVEAYCRIFRAAEHLHASLMEIICNPETGECPVSYEIPSEDMLFLEETVVAVLACMLALLSRSREEVLSGRSSLVNSFQAAAINTADGRLPPLALFRDEMKSCCESLEVALLNYLKPFENPRCNIWRRLQRLKNVCYDAGFSRREDCPSPKIFANWAAVLFSTMKEAIVWDDHVVAFWRGGQVTEEGLAWLLDKEFKTIVDLRAEGSMDEFYDSAIKQTVSSGKIELINLPVQPGTAPSMEQVEQFALLISDPRRNPLYLHSQEGVNRTSAMISRWRQYIALAEMNSAKRNSLACDFKPLKAVKGLEGQKLFDIIPMKAQGGTILDAENDYGLAAVEHTAGKFKEQDISISQKDNVNEKLNPNLTFMHNSVRSSDVNGATSHYSLKNDPFKEQLPKCDFFSRKEVTQFFQSRKTSPKTYFNSFRKKFEDACISRKTYTPTNAYISWWMKPRSSDGQPENKGHEYGASHTVLGKEENLKYRSSLSLKLAANGHHDKKSYAVAVDEPMVSFYPSSFSDQTLSTLTDRQILENGKVSSGLTGDGLDLMEGNMCASTTGVVRVQSRKKAEMFLVRTDGFTCTREKVTESSLAFTHPSTQQQMLMWKSLPKTVLLLKKLGQELIEEAKEVASYLYHQEKMNVLVEPDVHDVFARIPGFGFVQTFYIQDTSNLHERVDFVACLGGDGVILHASNLFRGAVPPVVSFNLGSLGFLTSHYFEDFRQDLKAVIHGNNSLGVYITLRMRLQCEILQNGKTMPGKAIDVLNEVVVDRGSNPYLSKIECYEHKRLITKVQGDGVIIATPTGSTAYSTAAGGSMVHPNVPCMLFTPICPHSLSFRPVILPDSAQLELKIPKDARSNAWVSFDGKRRQQLSRGDSVRICMSQHPLPTVNKCDQTGDWFHSLVRCLNWNERLDQKAL